MTSGGSDPFGREPVLSAPAYRLPIATVLEELQTDPEQGLSDARAAELLQRYGGNVLEERGRQSAYRLFLRQFQDLLIIVLMFAAALAWYLDDLRGASILAAIYNTMNERRREFAILRALGARRSTVSAACSLPSSSVSIHSRLSSSTDWVAFSE